MTQADRAAAPPLRRGCPCPALPPPTGTRVDPRRVLRAEEARDSGECARTSRCDRATGAGGGLIAVQILCGGTPHDPDNPPADTSTCELVEVGSYLDPAGNNFWGVETFVDENPDSPYFGRTVILASDRDSGLWIFIDP